MGEASAVDLFDGWRATFEPAGQWLSVRLHPPGGTGQYKLAELLWDEVRRRGATQVLVEMDDVAFLASAVMGELVRLHKRLAVAGGRMRLCGLREHPREALHVARLDEVIPTYATRGEALA
ncbi:STAS domain-containing protein [Botrimarina sp.]|uniref:STAS domain-containing protein n=1 Tax=Botrimarina sp. TaxID=2795802 RepID=UPI0032EF4DEF